MARKKKETKEKYMAVNWPMLNVRANPSTDSLVLKILPKGTIVEIDPNFNDPEWYHYATAPNIVGYSMKRYFAEPTEEQLATYTKGLIVIHPVCDANIEKEADEDANKENTECR